MVKLPQKHFEPTLTKFSIPLLGGFRKKSFWEDLILLSSNPSLFFDHCFRNLAALVSFIGIFFPALPKNGGYYVPKMSFPAGVDSSEGKI